MENQQLIKFKGFTISKEDFEKKYNVELSDLEWKIVSNTSNIEWQNKIEELRALAFKCVRKAMNSINYNTQLEGKDIVFVKGKD